MILYFSGTGNSEYVARRISLEVNDSLLSITASLKAEKMLKIPKSQPIIFVTPTYGWRLPRVVEAWIRRNKSIEGQKVYFVLTCGSDIGDSDKYLRKLCSDKGVEYMGVQQVIMPENYIAMFDVPSKEIAEEIIDNAEPSIMEVSQYIIDKEPIPKKKVTFADKVKSGIVNNLFYATIVKAKKFKATDKCIGCGKCERICPLHNIELKNGKPVWGKECTHCMACISYCPVEAIHYGGKTAEKRRYVCPR